MAGIADGMAVIMVGLMVGFMILFLIHGVDFIILTMDMVMDTATVMAILITIIIMVDITVVMDMVIIGEIMVVLKQLSLLIPQDLEQAVALVLVADLLEPAEMLALQKAIAICQF